MTNTRHPTCENCLHYAEKEVMDLDLSRLTLGYCAAIGSHPYRTPDYPVCKRYRARAHDNDPR